MEIVKRFLVDLKELTDRLNVRGEEAKAFDPLQDFSFSLKVERKEEIHVSITASYLSGGGVESSYVINDGCVFIIGPTHFESIVFTREIESREEPPVEINETGCRALLKRIDTFFLTIIPGT